MRRKRHTQRDTLKDAHWLKNQRKEETRWASCWQVLRWPGHTPSVRVSEGVWATLLHAGPDPKLLQEPLPGEAPRTQGGWAGKGRDWAGPWPQLRHLTVRPAERPAALLEPTSHQLLWLRGVCGGVRVLPGGPSVPQDLQSEPKGTAVSWRARVHPPSGQDLGCRHQALPRGTPTTSVTKSSFETNSWKPAFPRLKLLKNVLWNDN